MKDEALTTAESYPQLMLEAQLCFPLYSAARRVVNYYTPYLKPLGLTYTQYIVLLCLWEYGEMNVGDLCRKLYLDNGTITPLIKRMEQAGYMSRIRDTRDERGVKVRLTEAGWALREQVSVIPRKVGQCVRLPQEKALELYQLLNDLLTEQE